MFNNEIDFKTVNDGVTFEAKLAMPDTSNIAEALAEGGETVDALLDFVHSGIRGFSRNNVKAGRALAASWADVVALRKEAAEAKGGNGEALRISQAFKAAYKAYLESLNMPAQGVELLVRLAGSQKALEASKSSFIDRVQATVLNFAEALSDDDMSAYASIFDRISGAGVEVETEAMFGK